MPHQDNNYQLDGADNKEAFFNSWNLSPSVDAIQEFSIQVGQYPAEFGWAHSLLERPAATCPVSCGSIRMLRLTSPSRRCASPNLSSERTSAFRWGVESSRDRASRAARCIPTGRTTRKARLTFWPLTRMP